MDSIMNDILTTTKLEDKMFGSKDAQDPITLDHLRRELNELRQEVCSLRQCLHQHTGQPTAAQQSQITPNGADNAADDSKHTAETSFTIPDVSELPTFEDGICELLVWVHAMDAFFPPDAPQWYQKRLLQIVTSRLLTGPAKYWWLVMSRDTDTEWFYDWSQFKYKLSSYFLPYDHNVVTLARARRWHDSTEPVEKYLLEKTLLLEQAGPPYSVQEVFEKTLIEGISMQRCPDLESRWQLRKQARYPKQDTVCSFLRFVKKVALSM
ncbi:unnamed protein product [Sympodiomycopsis kandeliae]